MKFTRSTKRPSTSVSTVCLLLFTTIVVSWSFGSYHKSAGSCGTIERIHEELPSHGLGASSHRGLTAGIKAAHPLAIVYLAKNSSDGDDSVPSLSRSLDLVHVNVMPHTPADVLIFHRVREKEKRACMATTMHAIEEPCRCSSGSSLANRVPTTTAGGFASKHQARIKERWPSVRFVHLPARFWSTPAYIDELGASSSHDIGGFPIGYHHMVRYSD